MSSATHTVGRINKDTFLALVVLRFFTSLEEYVRQKNTGAQFSHTSGIHPTFCAYGPNARRRGPLVPVRNNLVKGSANVPEAVKQSEISRSSRMASALGNRIVKPTWKVAKKRVGYGYGVLGQ